MEVLEGGELVWREGVWAVRIIEGLVGDGKSGVLLWVWAGMVLVS
jgi:hypothetical protein